MKIEELIKDLDPIELIEFKNYLSENLTELCSKKNSNSQILSHNQNDKIYCKNCGCILHKNGKTNTGIQKYICSGCKNTSCETTDTITYHSKISFEIWKNVIDNLLDGFSLRRIAEENNISVLTAFRLRHKVLLALNSFEENIKLNNDVQSDEKYFSINLKGTKTKNMPRFSKKRTSKKSSYRGISHHKICVISAIDDSDNLILKIGGLGRGTTKMLKDNIGSKIENVKNITADSASAYQEFCEEFNINLIAIPSGFNSDGPNNLAEINGVHSQLQTWLRKFRGVSTRHLQQYLNWFNYIFTMKKRFELKKIKLESYRNIIIDNNYINSISIFKKSMPIDLNVAYAEYQ